MSRMSRDMSRPRSPVSCGFETYETYETSCCRSCRFPTSQSCSPVWHQRMHPPISPCLRNPRIRHSCYQVVRGESGRPCNFMSRMSRYLETPAIGAMQPRHPARHPDRSRCMSRGATKRVGRVAHAPSVAVAIENRRHLGPYSRGSPAVSGGPDSALGRPSALHGG